MDLLQNFEMSRIAWHIHVASQNLKFQEKKSYNNYLIHGESLLTNGILEALILLRLLVTFLIGIPRKEK